MIDVHTHVHQGSFPLDHPTQSLSTIIQEAKDNGVQRIISVSESGRDASWILQLAVESKGYISAGIGLHPAQVIDNEERSATFQDLEAFLPILHDAINNHNICCVGESTFRALYEWI
jgi:Tat protein secretion system quality control protein TatD with DNase activity